MPDYEGKITLVHIGILVLISKWCYMSIHLHVMISSWEGNKLKMILAADNFSYVRISPRLLITLYYFYESNCAIHDMMHDQGYNFYTNYWSIILLACWIQSAKMIWSRPMRVKYKAWHLFDIWLDMYLIFNHFILPSWDLPMSKCTQCRSKRKRIWPACIFDIIYHICLPIACNSCSMIRLRLQN